MSNKHPYNFQPERSFWRVSVGQRHYADLADLWTPMSLSKKDRIATAGSCFAQHIGNNLSIRGAAFMDMEPPPPIFNSAIDARKWGYGVMGFLVADMEIFIQLGNCCSCLMKLTVIVFLMSGCG